MTTVEEYRRAARATDDPDLARVLTDEADALSRFGYGDSGHPYTPDRHGRCRMASGGYCDGTRNDPSHQERPR